MSKPRSGKLGLLALTFLVGGTAPLFWAWKHTEPTRRYREMRRHADAIDSKDYGAWNHDDGELFWQQMEWFVANAPDECSRRIVESVQSEDLGERKFGAILASHLHWYESPRDDFEYPF